MGPDLKKIRAPKIGFPEIFPGNLPGIFQEFSLGISGIFQDIPAGLLFCLARADWCSRRPIRERVGIVAWQPGVRGG